MSRSRKLLLGLVCVAGFQLGTVWSVSPAVAGRPGGVGSNLHRSFMIRRAQRRAARGLPTTKHTGIWLSGGYPSSGHRSQTNSSSRAYRSYRTSPSHYSWWR